MKLQQIIPLVLLFIVSGCQPPQSMNTPTISVAPTPNSQRWMVYEKALSKTIVNKVDGLCEWEIWGQRGNEVYVWALCKAREPIGTAGSVPAVIHLANNGGIEKVVIPRDGNYYSKDIRELFPQNLLEKIVSFSFDGPKAEQHIKERMISNGPPLIAISSTLLP